MAGPLKRKCGAHITLTPVALLWNCRLRCHHMQHWRAHPPTSHTACHPAGGTHSTLTLLAPLWNCRCAGRQPADTTTRAQNTAICRQCAKPARSCRLGRGIRQVALTAPSRFLAPLWNCRPGSIRLTCPQTCTNRRNLHDIWPVSFARIACGTPYDKRHSQHPHAFGASWKCRSAGRQPPDKQQLAQNTAIYMQLCSIPCCEHIAWQVALTAPSRFSAPLWNCRPGRC